MAFRFIRRATVVIGATALTLSALGSAASAAPDGGAARDSRSPLPGTVPAWAQPSRASATPAASDTVSFTVALSLRDGDAAERLAMAVSDPTNRQYGHYLTPAQFNARFAPTPAQVARVRAFLTGQGMAVDQVAEGNRWIRATGTVAQVNHAFGAELKTYTWRGRKLRAPSKSASVPASVRPDVLAVTGLDDSAKLRHPLNRRLPEPGVTAASAAPGATPPAPSQCSNFWAQNYQTLPPAYGKTTFPTYICGYSPDQLQGAYDIKSTLAGGRNGHGVTVAIIDAYASPTMAADANAYARNFGQPEFTAGQYAETVFRPFGMQAECGGESAWNGEQTLDVEAVHSLAPGAAVRYIGARDCDQGIDEAINYAVQHRVADIVSNSYGNAGEDIPAAEIAKQHAMFVQAAAEGIGFYFSSGDSGDEVTLGNTPAAQPDYPASDPMVTAVGGTSLGVDAANGYQFETGWGTDIAPVDYSKSPARYTAAPPGTFRFGAGGGTSTVFAQPKYQAGKVPASLSRQFGGAPMRVSPDVAAIADPYTGFAIGQTVGGGFALSSIGGTSLACPVFAAIQALASTGRHTPIGFANPLLYGLKSSVYHDVVPQRVPTAVATPSGTALVTFDRDSTLATSFGYDDVTGLGSPRGGALLAEERKGR
ncbi:S8/S53 family peptidase [Planosporangium thailandense]|uniref:S8/S53 family peptidase n=1 Tax=Planosporangium thailandense TaxID=765197 RepID=A0ABX0Y5B1_9ACTN|nr:S53 family peptidase [Planosporangium thailandense]NJC73604.1 S8/S53 family peptidase [Planosporangium thailandense]